VVSHWRSVAALVMQTSLVWLFQVVVLLSSLWSIQPDYVNLMNREVWQMICFALFVVTQFSFVQQLRLITLTLGLGALGSAGFALFVPAIGRHIIDHVGAWKGLYDYKNTLRAEHCPHGGEFLRPARRQAGWADGCRDRGGDGQLGGTDRVGG
jgi:exopolysaccharide production protein ExoQ